jgi:glycosyltransferase involved in cell wall biosynthesis
MNIWDRNELSFGFVSTRFCGLDGVSLEARKWVDVLHAKNCQVYFMGGELDTPPEVSYLVPKAHFKQPDILDIHKTIFTKRRRTPELSKKIQTIKDELKKALRQFHHQFNFTILVVENASAIPLNLPLGLAINEFIMETAIPTIAHHHDFHWERSWFNSPVATDYLRAAFPPVHPNIQHVVINSLAGRELGERTGASWTLIPNIIDFKTLPPEMDDYNRDFKLDIGLDADTFMVLQPTRVVSRKGIEIAAEIVKRLGLPKASLVITHEADDEGEAYLAHIKEFARLIGVNLLLIADRIAVARTINRHLQKIYTLWDAYLNADLVVYPSLYEGYGNAFVESIYCRKPIAVNRYDIFAADIETKGFDVIKFDGYITAKTIAAIKALLSDPERIAAVTEKNYLLGWRFLSYEMLEEKLEQLLINYYGM